nr:zinc finger BED domain-containing protein RICESLEEPER 2-like [Tanacetum cinerariifolium]
MSMARDGSVFKYDPDYLREQFAGLVIQRALPFNHFDHEQTTRVFQNTMLPTYTHVSRSTLKRDAMKLWLAAKQEISDSFGNINAFVNLTTDVWSAPHGVPETDIKRMDADDQAIQTILLGLPEDVYAAVDSCEIAKEIWEHVRQMMKGSDIREQEKKAKLFNEWESSHLLTPEWKRHVIIVRQTKNLHETDFTHIYDFLKMNQEENGLVIVLGIANQSGTGNVIAARAEGDLDEIEEVNANYILMANLQQASKSSTQHDRAPVYDTDGSAEVHLNDNCYDNKIFNMFTQEEQYTDLLEPILEPQLV